jgi:integrase
VSHVPHTICRHGTYYYNRRVPKHAVISYGKFIRHSLSSDPLVAAISAERLSAVLEKSWKSKHSVSVINISAVLDSYKPSILTLSEVAAEYIALKNILSKPTEVAVRTLIELVGDKDVAEYYRDDAKAFVRYLGRSSNKTGTIRRRLTSLTAIFNYAYAELDLDKRNPFSRMIIKGEGEDSLQRGVFSNDQLQLGYDKALGSDSQVKLLMPLLGETGCRLAEIVGLRIEDIDLENDLIHIRPNSARRLKTRNSERTLPLVGYARSAMEIALGQSDGEWLYPRYIKDGKCYATHASNAVNKWLKRDFGGLTAHCLRHTMRDRLRAVECPMDMIDQIGGWKSVGGIGASYGRGYGLEQQKAWLEMVKVNDKDG